MEKWIRQNDGKTACIEHGTLFVAPLEVCPACAIGERPDFLVEDVPHDDDELPKAREHEVWLVRTSDVLMKLAKAYNTRNTAHLRLKAIEQAIRARNAALEMARWREDWHKTTKLEQEAKKLLGDV